MTATPQIDAQPAPPVVRCRGVRKSYRAGAAEIPALRGVDYEVAAPGFYAIMGQSGSGKSTLLHLLAALDRPDEGSIEITGQPIERFSEREATAFRRRRIGIVFQQFNLIPSLTAAENVELPGLLAADAWLEPGRRTPGDARPDGEGPTPPRRALRRRARASPSPASPLLPAHAPGRRAHRFDSTSASGSGRCWPTSPTAAG